MGLTREELKGRVAAARFKEWLDRDQAFKAGAGGYNQYLLLGKNRDAYLSGASVAGRDADTGRFRSDRFLVSLAVLAFWMGVVGGGIYGLYWLLSYLGQ